MKFAAAGLVLASVAGCAAPAHPDNEPQLRTAVLTAVRRDIEGSLGGDPNHRPVTAVRRAEQLGLAPEIMAELESTSGAGSYAGINAPLGEPLDGTQQQVANVSLQRVVLTTAANNLTLEFARLVPAIRQSDIVRAQAVFDWTLFASGQAQKLDNASQRTSFGLGPTLTREESTTATVGLRRVLESGGRVTVQNQYTHLENNSPGQFPNPDPAVSTSVTMQLDQPLLRNFGSDVALVEVRLATNAERDSIQQLKATLLQQTVDAESAYWNLVRAAGELKIAQRLLERGQEVSATLQRRQEKAKDVRASQLSDAVATVEARRADVIRAQNGLRQASDRVKQLMNDPALTVGSEVLAYPVDVPTAEPLALSLQDVVTTAIGNRPEVQRALLAIGDAALRQQLADNGRLPALDLRLQTRVSELDDKANEAYSRLTDGNFIDYLVGLNFEQPIGNRSAEADYRSRFLESMQARITYREVVQRVLLDVKAGLRSVVTTYRLIEQTRASRIAAAENLRTLEVEERTFQALTPEFLDLKLRRQQALAGAEAAELAAITEYNASIGRLYGSMGTALERNRIDFRAANADAPVAAVESIREGSR